MPRTTLDLDAGVLRELKRHAKEEGRSLGDLVSEIVAPLLRPPSRRKAVRFGWRTAPMGPARIDLEDKEAVRRTLET